MNSLVCQNVCRRFAVLILLLIGSHAAKSEEPAKGLLLPIPAKGSPIASTVTAGLNGSPTVDAIRAQGFDERERLANEIEQRLKISVSRFNEFKANTSGLTEIGKREFEQGLKDAENRRGDLENSLKAARNAPSSNAWEMARAELAASYALYVEAVARTEIGLMKTVAPSKDVAASHQ